jgi:cell fate (sporulation/competence/biofilm development) regulator YlbF (YheA/YmcA/DUF963 family)
MKSEERLDVILDELHRIRYGFERIEDNYRQARTDVAIEELQEIQERISEFRSAGIWPSEEQLDDLTAYQNNLTEEEE